MARTYELMLVLRPDLDEKDIKKRNEIIKKILSQNTYTVGEVKTIGKKTLAYPIDKHTEGLYVICTVSSPSLAVSKLEAMAKLDGSVIRYLLTKTAEG